MNAQSPQWDPDGSPTLQPLRVLIVGPYPVNGAPVGGVESAVFGLVAGLRCRPDIAAVHVADFRASVSVRTDERLDSTAVVHRLPAQRTLRLLNRAAGDSRLLKDLVAEVDPDVVHGQGIGLTGYIASISGRASVITVHGITVREMAQRAQGLADRLRVRALDGVAAATVRNARAVISISRYDQAEIAAYSPRFNPVIPNAVPPLCEPSDAVSREILFAGVLIPRKRVVETIDAVSSVSASVSGVKLWVAGPSVDDGYRKMVDEALARAGGSAVYLGGLDRASLAEVMSRVGILVLFAEQETLPVVVAEAMSCGRVVVATDVGGLSEMIEDGVDGVLVPPGDQLALVNTLSRVLCDDDLRVSMGRHAAKSASRYSPETVASETMAVYRQVIAR